MTLLNDRKHIAIWGYGKEGQSVHAYIKRHHPDIKVTAYSNQTELFADTEAEDLIETGIKGHKFDLVIKSPGVSLYHPFVTLAKQAGIPVSSATNLWFELYPNAKTIICSGTKGKSTTASLLYHLLKEIGYDTVLAGNIGVPLLDQVPAKDFTIIELSSYQLADLNAKPALFILTNLFKEHVPWHGSEDQYYQDKLQPLLTHPDIPCVINQNNETLMRYSNKATSRILADRKRFTDLVLPSTLRGQHNHDNIACTLTAIEYLTNDYGRALQHLLTYRGLRHRLEEIGTWEGRLLVNDSIATIPEATAAALDVYKDKTIILIMGGQDRGQDYTQLAKSLSPNQVKHVFLLPDNGWDISKALDHYNGSISYTHCDTLEDIRANVQDIEAEIILLSPGAPSYGHFKNFEERGEMFAHIFGC